MRGAAFVARCAEKRSGRRLIPPPTMGWTRTKRDVGGRLVEVQSFSGSALPSPWGANASSTGSVLTGFDADSTTVTDQAGQARRSRVDGLRRLAEVREDPAGSNFGTSYGYDALGNLTCVTQGGSVNSSDQCQSGQIRTFQYSSLSRLLSAANPESGTAGYQYDNGGRLTRRTSTLRVAWRRCNGKEAASTPAMPAAPFNTLRTAPSSR